MTQISTQEFERLPPRVHEVLTGVPLHDVWVVDLPRLRSGITLDGFFAQGKHASATWRTAIAARRATPKTHDT